MRTSKTIFKEAWRHCRLLNWGTLHFGYSRNISEACKYAYEKRRESSFHILTRLKLHKQGAKYYLPFN